MLILNLKEICHCNKQFGVRAAFQVLSDLLCVKNYLNSKILALAEPSIHASYLLIYMYCNSYNRQVLFCG